MLGLDVTKKEFGFIAVGLQVYLYFLFDSRVVILVFRDSVWHVSEVFIFRLKDKMENRCFSFSQGFFGSAWGGTTPLCCLLARSASKQKRE